MPSRGSHALIEPSFPEWLWDLSDHEFRLLVTAICQGELPNQLEPTWARWRYVKGEGAAAAERKRGKRLWPAVYERDGWACRRCSATEPLEVDHLRPVSRGGRSVMENMAVLCGPCNRSKSAKTWFEWTGEEPSWLG